MLRTIHKIPDRFLPEKKTNVENKERREKERKMRAEGGRRRRRRRN
jgi:hypothetical protein